MQLSDICVSLELAKQLKKAGYPQKGHLFSYIAYDGKFDPKDPLRFSNGYSSDEFTWCAAPISSEIAERFSKFVLTWKGSISDMYYCSYDRLKKNHIERSKTEVDARAKMWLYLKKKGLL